MGTKPGCQESLQQNGCTGSETNQTEINPLGNEPVYSALFSDNNSIMLLVDPVSLNIVDANRAAVAFYGWSHQELIKKKISDINTLQDDVIHKDAIKVIEGKQHQFAFRHKLASGSVRDVEVNSSPITINKSKLLYSIIQDVTSRKKIEEDLLISKQKLDLHLIQTPLAVIEWDLEFKVRSWNPAAEKIFGYTEKEMLGKHSSIIIPDEDKKHVDVVWERLMEQKGGGRSTNKNITKKGEILFCEWFNTPVIDKEGNTIAVFSLVGDITRQKNAEDTVQFERDKLKSVINAIGDMLYIINSDYIVEFQNDASRKEFGDLKGKKCFKSFFQLNEPCEYCLMHETLNMNCINQVETDTSNKKNYDIIFLPLRDINDEMKSVVLFRDITEKKFLQVEAIRSGHLASLGELAAGVAHEINNPVTGIISLAEVLIDKFEKLGGDKKIPEIIVSEGERISEIVKNLLSFARKKNDEKAPIHVYAFLQRSLDLVERHLFKDGIHLTVSIPDTDPKILANSQELQQVFINIISNARYALNKKYSGHNKNKTLEIFGEINDAETTPVVRLTFFDRGIGIPKASIESITDPFFSTKPHGEGTGLGLSISHGIIKNHGGRLLFESIEGEYAKVLIELPLHKELSLNGEI